MTVREELERAHCCEPLLAYATQLKLGHRYVGRLVCDEYEAHTDSCVSHSGPCLYPPNQDVVARCGLAFAEHGPRFIAIADLWRAIERHDWLLWLMARLPYKFEDSQRDLRHAYGELATVFVESEGLSRAEREARACAVLRGHVRLVAGA